MKKINLCYISLFLSFPLFSQELPRLEEALREPLTQSSNPYFSELDRELARGFQILVSEFLNQRSPKDSLEVTIHDQPFSTVSKYYPELAQATETGLIVTRLSVFVPSLSKEAVLRHWWNREFRLRAIPSLATYQILETVHETSFVFVEETASQYLGALAPTQSKQISKIYPNIENSISLSRAELLSSGTKADGFQPVSVRKGLLLVKEVKGGSWLYFIGAYKGQDFYHFLYRRMRKEIEKSYEKLILVLKGLSPPAGRTKVFAVTNPAQSMVAPLELPVYGPSPLLGKTMAAKALSQDISLQDLLSELNSKESRHQIKLNALTFSELQIRGLRRYCQQMRDGTAPPPPPPLSNEIPVEAFTVEEMAEARAFYLQIEEAGVESAWKKTASSRAALIRMLKQDCTGVSQTMNQLLLKIEKMSPGIDIDTLARDSKDILDMETAYPRIQYVGNGLSYRLGKEVVDHPHLLAKFHRFLYLYNKYIEERPIKPVIDVAIESAQGNLYDAMWLMTFAFRNLPHLYDIYLLNPELAAELEVLFLRFRSYRDPLRETDSLYLQHYYPTNVYAPQDIKPSVYHFWSGGYVALEMIRKGWSAEVAYLTGGIAQAGYEFSAILKYAREQIDTEPESFWQRLRFFADQNHTMSDSLGGFLGASAALDISMKPSYQYTSPTWRYVLIKSWVSGTDSE